MNTFVTIKEGDQVIGNFTHEAAPNDFIRGLIEEAELTSWAEAKGPDGVTVTATTDVHELWVDGQCHDRCGTWVSLDEDAGRVLERFPNAEITATHFHGGAPIDFWRLVDGKWV